MGKNRIEKFFKDIEEEDIKQQKKSKKVALNLEIKTTVEEDALFCIYVCKCGALNALNSNPLPATKSITCGGPDCEEIITIVKGPMECDCDCYDDDDEDEEEDFDQDNNEEDGKSGGYIW